MPGASQTLKQVHKQDIIIYSCFPNYGSAINRLLKIVLMF